MSERLKAALRAQGMTGEEASIVFDVVGHSADAASEAIKRVVEAAPPHLQPVILRGVIGSLVSMWNSMAPDVVDMAVKTPVAEARLGVVKVIRG